MATDGRHPATTGLLRWFEAGHLPPHLAAISRPCGELAELMVAELPDDPELSAGLRHLLEAKDAFVRAAIAAGPRITRDREPETLREAIRADLGLERDDPGPRGSVGGVPLPERGTLDDELERGGRHRPDDAGITLPPGGRP
jgi:hypothetical protein